MTCLFGSQITAAQQPGPGITIDCVAPESATIPAELLASVDTRTGGVFTPRGELRMLIVFAGFQPFDNSVPNLPEWPMDRVVPKCLPNYVDAVHPGNFYDYYAPSLFFRDLNAFNSIPANDRSLSRYFYDMSKGQLKVIADVYPIYVQLPTKSSDAANNTAVINKMFVETPNFDWSRYDNRINKGNYFVNDNSATLANPQQDNKPDYIVIVYRDSASWGGHTAFSSLSHSLTSVSPTFTYDGFTLSPGYNAAAQTMYPHGIRNVFLHELCHELYGAPHQYGNNGVTAKRFSYTRGWSMMSHDYGPSSANAWERYMLGWIDIGTDITHITSQAQNGNYTLTDFVTTGKALAIDLPKQGGGTQRLWLEYRAGLTPWDSRDYYTLNFLGGTIPLPQPSIYAFIEDHVNGLNRNLAIGQLDDGGANAMKALSPLGAYDVTLDNSAVWNAWGNIYDYYTLGRDNPLSLSSQQWLRRWNLPRKNTPNTIDYSSDNNGPGISSSEGSNYNSELGLDFWGDGYHHVFGVGTKIGISEKVIPASFSNHNFLAGPPVSDFGGQIFLNGISIEVISIGSGQAVINVKLDDTDITKDQRFTGNVVVPDLPNVTYDLNLKGCKTLTIDGSGIPNRLNTKDGAPYLNDFVDPTIFRIKGTYHQENLSRTEVLEGSAVIVEGTLHIEGGDFHIGAHSSLNLKAGSTLILGPTARLIIDAGAYLHMNPSTVTLSIAQGAYFDISDQVILNQSNSFVKYESGDLPSTLTLIQAQVATKFLHFSLMTSGCLDPYYYCASMLTLRLNTPFASNTTFSMGATTPPGVAVTSWAPNGNEVSFAFASSVTAFNASFTTTLPGGSTGGSAPFTLDYVKNTSVSIGGPPNTCYCLIDECAFVPEDPGGGGGAQSRRAKPTNPIAQSGILLSPNPATQSVTISLAQYRVVDETPEYDWSLFDNMGTMVRSGRSTLPLTIDVQRLRQGLYRFVGTIGNQSQAQTLRVE